MPGAMTAEARTDRPPLVLAIAGALTAGSASERVAQAILDEVAARGAETALIAGPALEAPIYARGRIDDSPAMQALLAALRRADAVVLVSPGYHGCVSGLLKNALDYVEDLSTDPRPYLSGRAVACVSVAGGWQGANVTLQALRNITHALRGWPTPLGLALNGQDLRLDDDHTRRQLRVAAGELMHFIGLRAGTPIR